ncbi:unnamed protein product [Periconia digitata]|uniref:Uncharacterized protein n=1 Tax=Periconia digitata TaxID=1303443 RepID=A0A9W4XD44_9PLEO|nr:unnamed protein product [Periconia digitata]
MLERASTCLETGGRQLLRAPKQCLPTRRKLHSAFWHHGANELHLPPMWWASPASTTAPPLHQSDSGDHVDRPRNTRVARPLEPPLLDFLYPEKTLALMYRWSTHPADSATIDSRRKLIKAPVIRQYSTSHWPPGDDRQLDNNLSLLEVNQELELLLLENTAEDALNKLLRSQEPWKQELAWLLYSSVSEASRPSANLPALLEYLADENMSRKVANRVIEVFNAIDYDDRQASSYQIAITAHVFLKSIGPAIQLQEEAVARYNTLEIGTDMILQCTIEDSQWDLAFRVFRTSRELMDWSSVKATHFHQSAFLKVIWSRVSQLPDLVERYHSFLIYAQQNQQDLSTTPTQRKDTQLFASGLITCVVDFVIDDPKPDEEYIYEFVSNLFRDLKAIKVAPDSLYEYTINKMLQTPRYQRYTNEKRKIWLDLYAQYRHLCLHYRETGDSPDRPPTVPSRVLVGRLIMQHGAMDSKKGVDDLMQDLREFYPGRNPWDGTTLSYVVGFYARAGSAERVHEYFEELQSKFPRWVSLHHLSSLVYVYSRRADVSGAVEQFKRINSEFGFMPDVVCWNNLLHAFCRADDLEGSIECFNNILDSGIKPDIMTFGPLLDLCAARGDVEAFETLFTKAQQMQIEVGRDTRARSGYVQAFLSSGDPEGAEAIVQVMHRDWYVGTMRGELSTHPWNIILMHYASRGDLENTRRIYAEMKTKKIPFDTWTYAALMRSLIETKNVRAAEKMFNETMTKKNMRKHAYHHAILMAGYIKTRQPHRARRILKRLQLTHVNQTQSSRQASIMTVGVTELEKLKSQRVKNPRARLIEVENELRRSIMTDYGSEIANNEPTYRRFIDSPELGNVPQGYFELVIMLYNTRGALDIAKQLFEAATKVSLPDANFKAPVALMSTIMETHFQAGEHDEVEACWKTVRRGADHLVKTLQQAMEDQEPATMFESVTDPALKEKMETTRISRQRRHVLTRAARVYVRSLCARKNDRDALARAQFAIHDLLASGFVIDTATWNEYIQHLALCGRLIDAFTAFEMYLMPAFPGWVDVTPAYKRNYPSGQLWMDYRKPQIGKHDVLPRYKTVVILAAAYVQVQREEREGRGYRQDLGGWMADIIERVAPMTIRAINTMPRTGDEIQTEYLYPK